MLVSLYVASTYGEGGSSDPARIAAQIVTGIGFLGAGTILRFGSSIRGLTTAASIWGVAAIGMAIGCGYYQAALVTTVIILIALYFLSKLGACLPAQVYFKSLNIKGLNIDRYLDMIRDILEKEKIGIEKLVWERDFLKKEVILVELFLKFPKKGLEEGLVKELSKLEGIEEIVVQ